MKNADHHNEIVENNLVEPSNVKKQKIVCSLSSDQLALIIRAASEQRLIITKSLNAVFKSLIPHLSTPYKEELSYSSVRKKSYSAEQNDKQTAILALGKLIERIKKY